MHLSWLVPALHAEVVDQGMMNIFGGGVDTLVINHVQKSVPLKIVLAMRVAGFATEWLNDHEVVILLSDSRGHEETAFKRFLSIPEAAILEPEREIGVLVPAVCAWQTHRPGSVTLRVLLDEDDQARIDIAIVEAGNYA